jgi:hypothetical protein
MSLPSAMGTTSTRRHRKFGINRRTFAILILASGLFAIAGSASAVIIVNAGHDSQLKTNSSDASSVWTTPANESNAPVVVVSGGASSGSGNFNDISCFSSSNCVAVGGDNNLEGLAAFSSDGGSSWTEGVVASGLQDLNAVDCQSANSCVAVGVAGTSTTSNDGATWKPRDIPTENTTLLGVSCATASTCVAVGVSPGNAGPYFGQLLLSTNGGNSWTVPTLPSNLGALGSVDCPSATFCVAVGDQILVSVDGGTSWSPRFVNGGTGALRSVSCNSTSSCVAIGPNPEGVSNANAGAFEIVSNDEGATWNPVSTPKGSSTIATVQCFGGDQCIAGGSAQSATSTAQMFQSSNDGTTWDSQPLTTGLQAIGSISCPSTFVCVFTGRGGANAIVDGLRNGTQSATSSVTSVVTAQNASAQ